MATINGTPGNDTLTGTSDADSINGGAGNDTIIGGGGGDVLTGGDGSDTFVYQSISDSTAAASDLITDFQTGIDKIDLSAISPINASIVRSGGSSFLFAQDGTGAQLQLASLHDINGDDIIGLSGGVTLIGDNNGDVLNGSASGDSVVGGSGNDQIQGGAGADVLTGGAGADTFVYNAASDSTSAAPDFITDFQTGVDKLFFSASIPITAINVVRSGAASFVFVATAISPSMQIDVDGAVNGTDFTSFVGSFARPVNLIGDNNGDTLIGSVQGEIIKGGTGNDTIIGGGGGDTLYGGGGTDTFKYLAYTGNAVDHVLDFIAGQDKLDLSALNPTDILVTVSSSGTSLRAANGVGDVMAVQLVGTQLQGTDIVTGNNVGLNMGDGPEGGTLIGSANGDTLQGGPGNDILIGGGGGDVIGVGSLSRIAGQPFTATDVNTIVYLAYSDSTAANPDLVAMKTGIDKIDLTALDVTSVSLVRTGTGTFLFADGPGGHLQIDGADDINGNDIITGGTNHGGVFIIDNNPNSFDNVLVGSDLGDPIQVGSAATTIIGGGGGDALFAGSGADTFGYQAYSDSTQAAPDGIFNFKSGTDKIDLSTLQTAEVTLVYSGGSTFLFADGPGEHLQINVVNSLVHGADVFLGANSTQGVNLIGDDNGDILIGTRNAETIHGGAGNDTIFAGGGGVGGQFNVGSGGGDAIFGGAGADTFVFTNTGDSTAATPDTIFDFVSGVDKLDLSAFSANGGPPPSTISSRFDNTFNVLSQNGSTFIFLTFASSPVQDVIILNGTATIAASDIIWSHAAASAPTEVAAHPVSETTAAAHPVASALSADLHSTTTTSFMPTMFEPHDPLNSLLGQSEFLAYQHQHDLLA